MSIKKIDYTKFKVNYTHVSNYWKFHLKGQGYWFCISVKGQGLTFNLQPLAMCFNSTNITLGSICSCFLVILVTSSYR